MQERKRSLVLNIAVTIALMLGLVLYEIQVYNVGFESTTKIIVALLFGFLTYVYTMFSLIVGPYVVIVTLEEHNEKVAYTLTGVMTLLIIFIHSIFWGIITKERFLIIAGAIVGIILIIMIMMIFSPKKSK